MRVVDGCDWITSFIETRRPCFVVRINDGEMIQMYRTRPEGSLLGTSEHPAPCRWELGDALREMIHGIDNRDDCLLGCSAGTERADGLCDNFLTDLIERSINIVHWANEHFPLDGACDGSARRMLEAALKTGKSYLIAGSKFRPIAPLFNCTLFTRDGDSWTDADRVYRLLQEKMEVGAICFWAAGAGLKPIAWKLWKEFPTSSHIDIGHVFNGALGMRDYGWLQRQDGWWNSYFSPGGFADWVTERCKL